MLPRTIQIMLESLLGPKGKSDPALRRAVFERTRTRTEQPSALLPALSSLLAKIDKEPWTITADNLSGLRRSGYSEDEIFELIAAASAGAGVRRFEAGLRALEGADAIQLSPGQLTDEQGSP